MARLGWGAVTFWLGSFLLSCEHEFDQYITPTQKIGNQLSQAVTVQYRLKCDGCDHEFSQVQVPANDEATVTFATFHERSHAAGGRKRSIAELEFTGETEGFIICTTLHELEANTRYSYDDAIPSAGYIVQLSEPPCWSSQVWPERPVLPTEEPPAEAAE